MNLDDKSLFLDAMEDVQPLKRNNDVHWHPGRNSRAPQRVDTLQLDNFLTTGYLDIVPLATPLEFKREGPSYTIDTVRHFIKEYGPDTFMCAGSARGPGNEAGYITQKFTRACIGTNNVDHCARICHAASVAGLRGTIGEGAMSVSVPTMAMNFGLSMCWDVIRAWYSFMGPQSECQHRKRRTAPPPESRFRCRRGRAARRRRISGCRSRCRHRQMPCCTC